MHQPPINIYHVNTVWLVNKYPQSHIMCVVMIPPGTELIGLVRPLSSLKNLFRVISSLRYSPISCTKYLYSRKKQFIRVIKVTHSYRFEALVVGEGSLKGKKA